MTRSSSSSSLTVLALALCTALAAHAQNIRTSLQVPADGPSQMPVLYVHGWKDDGALWGRGKGASCDPGKPGEPTALSGARLFAGAGIPSWAVQWWSTADGDPFSTHDTGYAFLSTGDELIDGSMWMDDGTYSAQNAPCPTALDVELKLDIQPIEIAGIGNNYNDSGAVEDHARDFLELLRHERAAGKLRDWRQVNVITHSKGSLVTRAMLDIAAQSPLSDEDYVANAIYNAPPFAGSSMVPLAQLLWSDDPDQVFASPWFQVLGDAMVAEGAQTVGEVFERIIRHLLEIGSRPGVPLTLTDLRRKVPPGTFEALDVLKLQPTYQVSGGFQWSQVLSLPHVAQTWLLVRHTVLPLMRTFMGFPAVPALDDLTPEAGHLWKYANQPAPNQYITYGTFVAGTVTFPCDLPAGGDPTVAGLLPCASSVGSNPALLHDMGAQVSSRGDLIVAAGSARILADTDAFGPPMKILAEHGKWHGDLIDDANGMGRDWLRVLLSPVTALDLTGAIVEVSAAERSYVVSATSAFGFTDSEVTQRTAPYFNASGEEVQNVHTARAESFEYRIVSADDSGLAPSAWVRVAPGASVSFNAVTPQVEAIAGAADAPFILQWRAINEHGGREMARAARFVVEPRAPQLVSSVIHGLSSEIAQRPSSLTALPRALRSPILAATASPELARLATGPEPRWRIRNPKDKALALILSGRGDIEYVWNRPDFTGTTVAEGVGGILLPLEGLQEGLNTLSFETSNLTSRSPRQTLRIFVDNIAPVAALQYRTDHALGLVVGPDTPLRVEVHDVGTSGGRGTVTVPGHPNGAVPANETFTLASSRLRAEGEAQGLVGGNVVLEVSASDLVGNTHKQSFTVYYDWSPPLLKLEEVTGALPSGPGAYRSFASEVSIAVSVTDSASGFDPPTALVVTQDGAQVNTGPMKDGSASGKPGKWLGTLQLTAGLNRIFVTSRDVVGNGGKLEFVIDYSPVAYDTVVVDALSYRLQGITCKTAAGAQAACVNGTIDNLASSLHGDAVLFDSAGNAFVQNDTNVERDVFLWRDGAIRRVSEGPNGEEGDDLSSHPAISADGRYAYFRSFSTTLVPGTSGLNLYMKELETGKIAVISRTAAGSPANVSNVDSFQKTAATANGRYVVFESRGNQHVAGLSDTNTQRDIFLVDVDPDGDGNYFEDDYVTSAISVATGGKTGNGLSRAPDMSMDGRYIVFLTQATDLHPALASNGNVIDAVLVALGGSASDGNLDPAQRTVVPINTTAANSGTMLAEGAWMVRVAPSSDTVVFSTRGNIANTGDANSTALGEDLYLSTRATSGGSVATRSIAWLSQARGAGAPQSSTVDRPFASVSVADEPTLPEVTDVKVAWVSVHSNMEVGDVNGVQDLFIRRKSPLFPAGMNVINWVAATQPSTAEARFGELSPDGRYAFWVTTQTYTSPYGTTSADTLYRRRVEGPFQTQLTVEISGGGTVERSPKGQGTQDVFTYGDDDRVSLHAVPSVGHRFSHWEGVDLASATSARVDTHRSRTVRAVFTPMVAPTLSADVQLTTEEDVRSTGVRPAIVDADPNDSHQLRIVTAPAHGAARVEDGLLVYTPQADFHGTDAFTFQVADSAGLELQTPATATVVVTAVNDAPARAQVSIQSSGSASAPTPPEVQDVDGDTSFTLAITVPPSHGVASVVGGSLVYAPNEGFTGSDDFLFTATDPAGASVSGTAEVQVRTDAHEPGTDEPPARGCGCGTSGAGWIGLAALAVFFHRRST